MSIEHDPPPFTYEQRLLDGTIVISSAVFRPDGSIETISRTVRALDPPGSIERARRMVEAIVREKHAKYAAPIALAQRLNPLTE